MPRLDKIKKVVENLDKDQPQTIDLAPYLREPQYSRKDVILPETTQRQVDLLLAELKHYQLIYHKWGMAQKHKHDTALCVNCWGLPGTGKTMTAEVIAHALGLKLLIVPYAQLESKYVGETPKNIEAVFEFAKSQNAVIFFDEADSFLGKRLENVTQSADTSVNLTRSVMLMKLSSHEGIVIFATNLIRNYDPAFISRIRWQIQFDLPDEAARAKIWQAQIPNELPIDESVDFTQLASQFAEVSGRDIKKAVLQAVVAAACEEKADAEKRVTQSHFTRAMEEVIAGNKAAEKTEVKLTPVTANVELPPEPSLTESKPTDEAA
ncbi:MAG: hypothetical protein Fur006_30920 [Coleofasciculaceae cyanobacterium]